MNLFCICGYSQIFYIKCYRHRESLFFERFFLSFLSLPKNTLVYLKFWVQFKKRVVRSSFFATQKITDLEKIETDFFNSFLKLFDFLENYPAKHGFLGAIDIKSWANFFCISDLPKVIHTNIYRPLKGLLFFERFFKLILSQKYPPYLR